MKLVHKLAAGAVSLVASVSAFATGTVDYSSLATGAQSELTSALAAAVPLGGIIIGVTVGYHVFKKFVKG